MMVARGVGNEKEGLKPYHAYGDYEPAFNSITEKLLLLLCRPLRTDLILLS